MEHEQKATHSHGTPRARAAFWLAPADGHRQAPLPGVDVELPSQEVVDNLCAFLRTAGHEPISYELMERYVHRVMPAVTEHWRTSEICEAEIRQLKQVLKDKREEKDRAAEAFVRSMALAGLPLQPEAHQRGATVGEPTIGLTLVEEALEQDCARPDEIAGRYGVEPVNRPGGWAKFVKGAANWVLPVAVGIVFGVNLAVLTGFVDFESLQKGRGYAPALVGILAGIAIEATLGACFAAVGWLLATALEPATSEEEGRFPRHKGLWLVAPLALLVLLALAAGIVTVDALGLRLLQKEVIEQTFAENVEELLQPMWVYVVAGAVISLPYLIFKFMNAWRNSSDNLREARIALLAQRYLSERRQNESVCEAFAAAQRYRDLSAEVERIEKEIQVVQTRHDRARDAACEEAKRFIERWDEVIAMLQQTRTGDASPSSTAPPVETVPADAQNGATAEAEPSKPNESWLERIRRRLGRRNGGGASESGNNSYLS